MTDYRNPLIPSLRHLTSRARLDTHAVKTSAGTPRPEQGELTDHHLAHHCNGGPARGLYFVRPGESVITMAALDFDSHHGETPWPQMCLTVGKVAEMLELTWALRPVVFRSSGGSGVHLYLTWDSPQDTYSVRALLQGVLAVCGLREGSNKGGVAAGVVEIFPKNDVVPEGKFGNLLYLPYANESELLEYDELSGAYLSCGKVAPTEWPASSSVHPVAKPVREAHDGPVSGAGIGDGEDRSTWPEWRHALADSRYRSDGRGDWRDTVMAVHHESSGSDDGEALARAWTHEDNEDGRWGAVADVDAAFDKLWGSIRGSADTDGKVVTGDRILATARRLFGWVSATVLGPLEDPDEGTDPEADRRLMPRRHLMDRAAEAARAALAPIERRGVPPAVHLTTDLANANRIVLAYGASLLVVGEKWYVWTGKVWRMDEGDVYRFACKLSSIIRAEAKSLRGRASASTVFGEGANERAEEIAKALEKWSVKSEMRPSIEAALGLARKMLTVDASLLNADRGLLNCRNGVVNLRTGVLSGHAPELFMTHLVDVDYVPGADQSEWARVVHQITREEGTWAEGKGRNGGAGGQGAPVASFLQRWFGYCATGEVSEQAFVVHWGDGANGKSTLIDTIGRVLGSYSGTAAPGLITSAGKRGQEHPTGLASLMGRRMVVAHESGDGAVLTDDVVKAITGGDRITARFMNKDFFEFDPTHKIQLLTNHKPSIKGMDHGIWRRVCLVAYKAVFGTAEEVASGRATSVKDIELGRRLQAAPATLQGVLAWLVDGAVAWYDGGLQPPATVLDASRAYQHSQDRVAHFVEECCELGADPETGEVFEEPMMIGTQGLYPAYAGWCKEAGIFALARARFGSELERLHPALRFRDVRRKTTGGAWRKVRMAVGIRLPE